MKTTRLYSVILFLAVATMASGQGYSSAIFEWDKLPVRKTASGEVRDIYNGPTRSLEKFEVKAITLNKGKSFRSYAVEKGSDELIIVKEGSIEVAVNSKKLLLDEGDVLVSYQGDNIAVANSGSSNSTYFTFLFNPRGKDHTGQLKSGDKPVYSDWSELEFNVSEIGGRRDLIRQPTAVLRELEIHATTLNAGLSSHAGHTHPDEEIVLMRMGSVDETINGKTQKIGVGSMMFATNDDFHGVSNASKEEKCEYYAFRWLVNE